jgi:hypothetical protein
MQENMKMTELLDTAAAARHLGLSVETMNRWRVLGTGPVYAKLSPGNRGPVRYRRADLDAFIASKTVGEV